MTTARSSLFVNGDFEADAIGATPGGGGWIVSKFLNTLGVTDLRPAQQTLASLNLPTAPDTSYFATHVVGGATESQPDPDLGTGASLRYPKYGLRAAVVNYNSPTLLGNNHNENMLTQTMTTTNADVDPADNKVHIRFAIAPVLYNSTHAYSAQPYYYVELDNLTNPGTKPLYQDFNVSAQPGVPWKTDGASALYFYTDWSLVDIAPGNAGLAVGDQVKLIVIASGCSSTGHFGRVYVDGIGSTIPGIYTSAIGPASANAGSDITYVVSYKNGGTATALATQLKMVTPTAVAPISPATIWSIGTTYRSNSIPSACSGIAVGGTGTLTCALGDLAPGASGSFTVTLNINTTRSDGAAATTGPAAVTNGNYTIQATGVSPLLGPKVVTTVTSGVSYADVSLTKTDGVAAIGWGQAVTYTLVASNAGPGSATTVTIADTMPAQLSGATWTCSATGGGSCPASGTGNLSGNTSLPVGATATYLINGTIIAGTGTGTVTNTATATLGGGAIDPDTTNNSAVDTDSIGVLRTLSLTKTNPNGGSVITVPASISCGTSCTTATGAFVNGTSVVLTASPVSGASFTAWGGACTGSTSTCTITMTSDLSVTAAFTPPPTVNISTGNSQGAALGTAFGIPLKVLVLTSGGTPVAAGSVVLFSAPSSGASATLSAASATTDASGFATITAIANGTSGAYSVIAALSGTPTTGTFSLWNYGAASSISVVGSATQSATVLTAFAPALTVVVRDAASQPVPGVTVTFAAPTSGARATLGTGPFTTNSAGQTSVSATAGQTAGVYTVTGSVTGIVTPATFTLTNAPGAAASIAATSGGGQTAAIGAAFTQPLIVTVRDAQTNPVPGALVTFTTPGSGAAAVLATATGTTDTSGRVSMTVSANGTVGAYSVTATVVGAAGPVSFALGNFGPLVLAPASSTAAPGAAITFGATGDPTASYVFSLSSNLSGGSIDPSTGSYVAGATGSVTDTVRVTDSLTRTSTATVTVSAALAISPSPASVAPRGALTFTAAGGSGTGFTYVLLINLSGGSINSSTGLYRAGPTGSVIDTVKVTDSLARTAVAAVTVRPSLSISPPSSSLPPRGAGTFTAAGGSGAGFIYAFSTNLSGGSINSATGAYTAGVTGGVTDFVTVTDPLGNSATATVTVSSGVTISPSALSRAPHDTAIFTAAGGSGTGFIYTVSTNASGASINGTSGAYLAGVTGSVTDSVTVTDSLGNSATATVSVTAAVSVSPSAASVSPRGGRTFTAAGGSGTGYTYALSTNASGGSISPGGVYTAGATGNVTDVVTVTDSLTRTATAIVAVGPRVTITPSATGVSPRGGRTFTAAGGSATGYTYALSANPSGGSINSTSGLYTAGVTGGVADSVTVTDSLGNSATATVAVSPGVTITPSALSLPPHGPTTFTATGGSATGFTFTVSTNASGASINGTTGVYLAGVTGGVTDSVTVRDSLGNTATAMVTVTAAVSVSPTTLSLPPRGAGTFTAAGGSGTGFTYALSTNLSGGSIDASGAYTAGATGNVTDVVTVTDSLGRTATASVTVGPRITVTPSATGISPRGARTFTAAGGSGTGFTYALSTNLSGGSIDGPSGAYTAGAIGSVTDVVTVTDSLGNLATANISVGGALSLSPSGPHTSPRGPLTFVATGGSGDGYLYSVTTNLSVGATIDASGSYVAGTTGDVTDVVSVVDSLGNSATSSITIGSAVSLLASDTSAPPRGSLTLVATGGSGTGFIFSFDENNSGGSIDPGTGAYTAGAMGGLTDVVVVVDSLGNSASARIPVNAGLSLAPASPRTPPSGTITFSATGGTSEGYTYSVTTNHSGATIDASGKFIAGPNGNVTDVVTVSDSLGNSTAISVAVGPAVTLIVSGTSTPPRGSLTFSPTGGSGTGFVFSFGSSASGGTIDPTSGAYTAGSADLVTDTIVVMDSLGNTTSANIDVSAGVSITPSSPATPPQGQVNLVAHGGSGTGFAFVILTNHSGAAAVDGPSGLYTAGAIGNSVDLVQATDSLGNLATVAISVGNGLTINPSTTSVAPRQSQLFSAIGGSATGFSFALGTNASGGTINAMTGAYVAGPTGGVSDVITVTDSIGNTASATAQVGPGLTVTPAVLTLAPLGARSISVSGGSGNGYRFVLGASGSGGSIDPSTGAYQAGSTGSATDVVLVNDSLGNTSSMTVTVTPALQSGANVLSLPPQASATLPVTGGAGGYSFALTTNGSGATLDPLSGVYVAGDTGNTSDLVTVTDSNGANTTIRVNVGPGISLAPATPTAAPRAHLTFTATGGNESGYRFSITAGPSGGSIDPDSGVYQAGATSNVLDVVQVVDALGNVASVSISIGGGLSINPASLAVAPQTTLTFAAAGGSGTGFVFTLTGNRSGASIVPETGVYQAGLTPNVTDQITATDSLGNTVAASVAVGGGVLIAPVSSTTAPGGTVVLSAQGGSGTGYVFALTGNNSGGTIDTGTGRYLAGSTPAVTDTVTVSDSLGNLAVATVDVGAGLSLSAPSLQLPPRSTLTLTAMGGSGTYSFAVRNNGSGASVVATTGVYRAGGIPDSTDLVEVTDDLGNRASLQITVGDGVALVPTSPVLAPGGSVTFTANGGSGTGYIFTITVAGSGGTLDPSSGVYVAGDTNDTVDVVTATDSLGNIGQVSIVVGDRVALNPPTASVAPHATVQLTASGGSSSAYTFALITNSSGATIDARTGAYRAGSVPNVTDVVQVVDEVGKSATAVVMVGAQIGITPAAATVAPKGEIGFVVSNGSGSGYVFTLTTNGSGGTVNATNGDYQAGLTGGSTDVVTVTDSLGNSTAITIIVGGGLSLTPAERALPPRGSVRLAITGGQSPYAFAVSTNNSGGTINGATGEYVAGPTPGVMDVVTVSDANGVSRSVTLTVTAGISILPTSPQVAPGGTVQLDASGGSDQGFTWRLVDNSAGGSVDAASGLYTAQHAPAHGTSDVIDVHDSLGNVARVTIAPNAKVVTVSASGGSGGCTLDAAPVGPGGLWAPLLGLLALVFRRRRREHLS